LCFFSLYVFPAHLVATLQKKVYFSNCYKGVLFSSPCLEVFALSCLAASKPTCQLLKRGLTTANLKITYYNDRVLV